jgi:hypothetical protein
MSNPFESHEVRRSEPSLPQAQNLYAQDSIRLSALGNDDLFQQVSEFIRNTNEEVRHASQCLVFVFVN